MSTIAPAVNPSLIASGTILLSDLLRSGYFQRNAFRILELPVNSTRRQIDKRVQMIEMAVQNQMAVEPGIGRCLPRAIVPDSSTLGEARSRLTDVRRRFVDELFWFWSDLDPAAAAATALAAGQTNEAVAVWEILEDAGPNDPKGLVAIHNIAVLYLLSAVSMAESTELESDRREAPGVFEGALMRWQILLESPAFWSCLEARVKEMEHPRLNDVVPSLRAALPNVLAFMPLLGVASMPVPLANQLIKLLRESDLPSDAVDHALGQAAGNLSQRILSAAQAAKDAANNAPLHAAQTCTAFLDHIESWLAIIDLLLPTGDSTRIKAHDDAALAVLSCQSDFCAETDRWDLGVQLLERGAKLAASNDTVMQLNSNLETVRKNHDRQDSFRGPGYHDLPKLIFDEMEMARLDVRAQNFDSAISRLRNLHKRGGPHTLAVSKALAYTLGCCSINRITHGMDNLLDPVDYVRRKLQERVNSPGFMHTAIMAQSGNLTYGAECMVCGQSIYGSYTTLRLPDINLPVIVCPSCSAKLDRMQDDRKSQLRRVFQQALDELYESNNLDPANKWVSDQITVTEKIARDIGMTVRRPPPPKPSKLPKTSKPAATPSTRSRSSAPALNPSYAEISEKRWGILVVCVILFGGFYLLYNNGTDQAVAPLVAEAASQPLNSTLKSATPPANLTVGSTTRSATTVGRTITTPGGVKYEVLRSGDGPKPSARSRVRVQSAQISEDGKVLADTVKFEEYYLPNILKGLSEGIQLMPQGSKFRFNIPQNTGDGKVRMIEIELIKIL